MVSTIDITDGNTDTSLHYFSTEKVCEHIYICTNQLLKICLQIMIQFWHFFLISYFLSEMYLGREHIVNVNLYTIVSLYVNCV